MTGFFNTSFGARLANDLRKRAGSVELIDGMNGLEAYYERHKLVAKANPIVNGKSKKDFHVAHKVALNDSGGRKGLYSKSNLIVVPARLNQSFGNQAIFINAEPGEHFLWTKDLQKKFKVDESTSHDELRNLLISFLGHEFIEWVDDKNLSRRKPKGESIN
ncbi:hypothetical protein [Shewanella saliphila]|uniref:HNH endonuclease n=1 Tax=Shewanella saliphila TaxID=2282698 RepID=A0ABQ2QBE9_9GAMM|nr:hypothetical protein [Shewanella saliphila]MCL1103637.1 hypothetical protein [Shewanella saliphila]GGP71851.1 hypothetical protein GCM10009409_39630 [Shewanella saliphila]